MATMPGWQIKEVLRAFQDRLNDLKRDQRFRYILVFKNHGAEAGASVDHPHCQLIALPIVPVNVQRELEGARRYYGYKERCVYCDILAQELQTHSRIVDLNEGVAALAPFAARMPFETWILPRGHRAHFENSGDEELTQTAEILGNVLGRLRVLLNDPPYNFMLHTSPCTEGPLEYYHWHIEVMPKLSHVAGFEWGTGFYINTVPPEEAARFLRETTPPARSGESIS